MKKMSIIAFSTLISLTLNAQLKDGLNKFETTNIIKNGSKIIIITNDPLTIEKINELTISYDCYPCQDSNNGKAIMFTFLSKDESLILPCCISKRECENEILVEN
jgi:hypothetical protein